MTAALAALLPRARARVGVVAPEARVDRDSLRGLLRTNLADTLSLEPRERERVIDLATRPARAGKFHVSISHLHDQGAWLSADFPCGIDLESAARVRADVLARVCTPGEVEAAPTPDALWTAKEAAFKACVNGGGLSQVLSQIEIHDWSHVTENGLEGWRFFWRSRISQETGCGASSRWNGTSFSFAMLSSQLWS